MTRPIKRGERPMIRVKRGGIRLDGVYLTHVCSRCVVVSIDCSSKYPQPQHMVATDGNGFEILLYADEHTLRPDPKRKDKNTEIWIDGLPACAANEVWMPVVSVGRYEVIVAFARYGPGKQVWQESKRERARYCIDCGTVDGHAADCAKKRPAKKRRSA